MKRNDGSRWIWLYLRGVLAVGVLAVAGPAAALGADRIVLGEEFSATW